MVVKQFIFFLILCGPGSVFGQGAHFVSLSWSWQQASGAGATGFSIKRGTVSGGPYTQVGVVGSPAILFFTDTGPFIEGNTYYYVVTAVGPGGESSPSNEASATIPISLLSAWPLAGLTVSKSHTGNFTQGQLNAAYTVIVSNRALAGPSSGAVAVTESVPAGLSLVLMAGDGWTCPSGSNACTRSETLLAGASYPPLTVKVNVAANAASLLTNQVSVLGGGSAPASASDPTIVSPQNTLHFVPVVPCRIADTRASNGPFGGPALAGGSTRAFIIPNSVCRIPVMAQAYSVNVTVAPSGSLGFVTVWPAGQPQPVASTLNSLDGRVKSNAAIVRAGTGGAISVFASNATDLVLDINGYFVAAGEITSLAFYPIAPCRIADTRKPAAPLGGPSLIGGQGRTFPIQSGSCNLPSTSQAYSLNFTALPVSPIGYVTTWPAGQPQPVASSLNFSTGAITANAALVPAGNSGSIDVFASNNTDLIIDINGYFASPGPGGLSLYTVTPCRVLDTRQPSGSAPISSLDVAMSGGKCGIPATVQAYILNATAVPQGSLGYLTLWPQGQAIPLASTLNALDGALTSNMAIVPTNNGSISIFASNPTDVVIDILGYFGP
jgi:hypothetical protein